VHSLSIRARGRFSPHVPSPTGELARSVYSRADDEPSTRAPRVSARGISELFDSYFDVFGLFALQPRDESSFTAGLPTRRLFEERNPASERRRLVKSRESLWKIPRKLPRPEETGSEGEGARAQSGAICSARTRSRSIRTAELSPRAAELRASAHPQT